MAFALMKAPDEELYTFLPDGSEKRTRVFAELSVVRLLKDAPALEGGFVRAGSVGTIVSVHGGGVAYDVEINGKDKLASAYAEDLELAE